MLANDRRVRGSLRGAGIDVLDLYRFDVAQPSILSLRLSTGADHPFDLRLVGRKGGRIACACGDSGSRELRLRVRPGRYFVAVRSRAGANGAYRLSRLARTITRTAVRVDGERAARLRPGEAAGIAVSVAPDASGPVTVDIERFDPLAGWQFHSRHRRTAAGGRATVVFTPPSEGRWRVRATFDGTRRAAASGPATASFEVAPPLRGDWRGGGLTRAAGEGRIAPMPPAARVGDMHTCPMVTGVVPHVGGPILPPGAMTVLIGGLPAARMGDMCTCVGPPDVIAKGSATVMIKGMPAARMGDMTSHGGVIVLGYPTVNING